MKKLSFINGLKYISCLMVVTQGLLLALLATFFLEQQYINKLREYPQQSYHVTLTDIPQTKTYQTLDYLQQASQEYDLLIVKQDIVLHNNNDVGVNNILLSVMGNVEMLQANMTYLNQVIVTNKDLYQLLNSPQNGVLGYDISSNNIIKTLPKFKFGYNITIKKMISVIDEQQTINGFYHILGLDSQEEELFLSQLSNITGVDKRMFDSHLSGVFIDDSFQELIYIVLFMAHTLVLLALIIILTVQSIKNLGVKMLLGWSKKRFILQLYYPLILSSISSIIIVLMYSYYLADFSFNTILFFSTSLLIGVINLGVIFLLCSLASLFIFIIRPISAIRQRLNKKTMIIVTSLFYVLSSIGLMAMCSYIDGPYQAIQKNTSLLHTWAKYGDYYTLSSAQVGLDNASFTNHSNKYNEDFYNWYTSIADKEGVYLLKTNYFSKSLLDKYKQLKVYQITPTQPFWLFNMSPNYIQKERLNVPKQALVLAKEGKRVYLIPDTLAQQEVELLKGMLVDKDTKSKKVENIKTVFTEQKQILYCLS